MAPGSEYDRCVTGGGKLKLLRVSKDSDKRAKKKAKKKAKKREKMMRENADNERGPTEVVGTRRRFENQSGLRNKPDQLSQSLTRNQLNKINVLAEREVSDLIKDAGVSYREKQDRFNKYCQDITETN